MNIIQLLIKDDDYILNKGLMCADARKYEKPIKIRFKGYNKIKIKNKFINAGKFVPIFQNEEFERDEINIPVNDLNNNFDKMFLDKNVKVEESKVGSTNYALEKYHILTKTYMEDLKKENQ